MGAPARAALGRARRGLDGRQRGLPGGACWAFVHDKLRFMLFGLYPANEHWRPFAMCLLFVAMLVATCLETTPGKALAGAWAAALIVMLVLLGGDPHGGATLLLMLGAAGIEARGAWSQGRPGFARSSSRQEA